MRLRRRHTTLAKLNTLRKRRRFQTLLTLGLVFLGPVLAVLTFLVLGPVDAARSGYWLRPVLLADFIYVMVISTLVLQRIAQMIAARRARSAGSRLHLRLTGVFAVVALLPTILVAVFAALTINFGLEGWFSERVRTVIGSSLGAAEAYEAEHRRDLVRDARALGVFLDEERGRRGVLLSDGELQAVLANGQQQVQRGLKEAFVVNGSGVLRSRGDRSYLFDFEQISPEDLAKALVGKVPVIQDWANNEFRALIALRNYPDHLLYVSRTVDGELLSLLDDTRETAGLYQQLESDRGRLLFEFGLLYLGFAVMLILAAIWLGLWFAERLARPVGQLAGAVQKVGAGDFDVQVREEEGDDEIAMLSRIFNQMTLQLRAQRDNLIENTRQIERRRRMFDSVLSSVTAGLIGLNDEGRIAFVNRAATRILSMDPHDAADAAPDPISIAVPEFSAMFEELRDSGRDVMQEEIRVTRDGKQEILLVRMAIRRNQEGQAEGYVLAFDDVTDLVSAQRMAAWGDVARRIAHEIKNPLTPIQLSAERMKRKYEPKLPEADGQTLVQLADVIIRQTGDLRRIVDEFSQFARMPEPVCRSADLTALVRDAVTLQDTGQENVRVSGELPETPLIADIDQTMLSQALTNLIKNAGEATQTLTDEGRAPAGYQAQVKVTLQVTEMNIEITVSDNGTGLPEDRARLFEPYVTTRDTGTGLGLPIVKKIVEEHGGSLELTEAELFDGCSHHGAKAVILLPLRDTAANDIGRIT
ncbi:sensor histidine kinase NtrY-like [Halocynthiibacter styelae]|uniref:histidine kinase n=1 Tax=Halocynthiibacter styelae TaxID=2761955 RepID=A0A8J7INK1_9RHOB|nr:PAS domain-containing sensor histidine kinase [Paenihalocynthiibacter styelae]MBI1492216.1 PAS domain-containing sensor histidine kinase [Paenihalocynthiibacter styelae]